MISRVIGLSSVIRIFVTVFGCSVILIFVLKGLTINIGTTKLKTMYKDMYPSKVKYKDVTFASECSPKPEFPETMEENIEVVSNYKFSVPGSYIKDLMLDKNGIKTLTAQDQNSSIPVLAIALSSNHFREFCSTMQFNSQNLLKTFPTMKVVIFDIGLIQTEIDYIRHHYHNFMIRKYPFEKFPNHVRNLKNYCWKPLAIQMLLKEYDFVYWTDSSVKTFAQKAKHLFQSAIRHGIQGGTQELSRTFPQKDFPETITGRTSPLLFKFLNEDPCLFRFPEISGGWNMIKRSEFTLKNIMLPWVSCALQYGCMEFPNSNKLLLCPMGKEFKVGSCHRYDQSVFGILLTRLFNKKRDDVTFVRKDYGILTKF